jgi:hypothetical protein
MDCVPVANQRDGQQRRRYDQQSSGLESVHVMPVPAVSRACLIHGGVDALIVAPDKPVENGRIYQEYAGMVTG